MNHFVHLRFIDTAEEYPEMLADMTTSLAVQLMDRSMCSYPSERLKEHEDKTHLHEAGAGISYWLTEPCMQSGPIRTSFFYMKRHHHIHLNTVFKADVEWWLFFMERWNMGWDINTIHKSRWLPRRLPTVR